MLLTLTTTHTPATGPATDLGYLLGKHPGRAQSFELSFGTAHVFYPEASEQRCTAALLLDVDPVGLIRRQRKDEGFALAQYTNDRPYVASSFLAVAISRLFGSALGGRCRERPALAEAKIPLRATLAVVPVRGGDDYLRGLFAPLGYRVEFVRHPLAPDVPFLRGQSPYFTLTLEKTTRLADLLRHLTVLVPVLDDDKHYYVGDAEVDKLLARGDGWLAEHPLRESISLRYLKRRRSLTRDAMRRLRDGEPDDDATGDEGGSASDAAEAELERRATPTLGEQRMESVVSALKEAGARTVVDVGCGEGKLLRRLAREREFTRVVGMDVSLTTLQRARARLGLDPGAPPRRRGPELELFQGSLTYRDQRLQGFDAACAVEVIEHIDKPRLRAVERVLFEFARPRVVIVTTPNVEYNVNYERLEAGAFRHRDHRFEWTRTQFESWGRKVAERHGYFVEFAPIGPEDPKLGAPTQLGVFRR